MRVSQADETVGLDISQHDEHYGRLSTENRELAEYFNEN